MAVGDGVEKLWFWESRSFCFPVLQEMFQFFVVVEAMLLLDLWHWHGDSYTALVLQRPQNWCEGKLLKQYNLAGVDKDVKTPCNTICSTCRNNNVPVVSSGFDHPLHKLSDLVQQWRQTRIVGVLQSRLDVEFTLVRGARHTLERSFTMRLKWHVSEVDVCACDWEEAIVWQTPNQKNGVWMWLVDIWNIQPEIRRVPLLHPLGKKAHMWEGLVGTHSKVLSWRYSEDNNTVYGNSLSPRKQSRVVSTPLYLEHTVKQTLKTARR